MNTSRTSLRKVVTVSLLLSALSTLAAGIPNVGIELQRSKIHHAGVAVIMDFLITNNSTKPITVNLDANPFENHRNVIADGDTYSLAGSGEYNNIMVPPGESVKQILYVDNVPYNVNSFDKITLKGRSSATTQSNPYGEFTYTYTDVQIPGFPNSNRPKCFFLDTEFDMTVDKAVPNGNDLEILCTLTNNGKRNKRVSCSSTGKATDEDGDKYGVEDSQKYSSTDISSGESERVKVIVKDGAKRTFKNIRLMYDVSEIGGDNLSYPVLLQLDGVTRAD